MQPSDLSNFEGFCWSMPDSAKQTEDEAFRGMDKLVV